MERIVASTGTGLVHSSRSMSPGGWYGGRYVCTDVSTHYSSFSYDQLWSTVSQSVARVWLFLSLVHFERCSLFNLTA